MPIKPVKRPLNIQDALYYEDIIYYLKKEGGLDYEPNEETEKRIQARLEEKEDLASISPPIILKQKISLFMQDISLLLGVICLKNNVPLDELKKNPLKYLGNFPKELKQVIAGLEEKVKDLKASTPKLELVPKK